MQEVPETLCIFKVKDKELNGKDIFNAKTKKVIKKLEIELEKQQCIGHTTIIIRSTKKRRG